MAARDSALRARKAPVSRNPNVRLVPMRAQADVRGVGQNTTFGQRRGAFSGAKVNGRVANRDSVKFSADGGMEMTFIPSTSGDANEDGDRAGHKADSKTRRKGVETFAAGLEKGGEAPEMAMSESERKGRTHRRKGMRSGSKNTFRKM